MSPLSDLLNRSAWNRIPETALPQLVQDAVHARVAIIVVICTTVLAGLGRIPADVTGAVYTGVVGYVAGRAGNINRGSPSRIDDNEVSNVRGLGAGRP